MPRKISILDKEIADLLKRCVRSLGFLKPHLRKELVCLWNQERVISHI